MYVLFIFHSYCIQCTDTHTLWSITKCASKVLQQLLQILTNFDNFCIKLTRNK